MISSGTGTDSPLITGSCNFELAVIGVSCSFSLLIVLELISEDSFTTVVDITPDSGFSVCFLLHELKKDAKTISKKIRRITDRSLQ
jgi:hypothetical protein